MEGPQITGACPSCLAPACGGICESCGDPNGGFDLVPDTAPGSVSIAREPRLTLDLEAYRPFLADFFAKCEVQSPKLRAKLSEWMSKPLGRFLLSGPAPRGLDAPAGTPPGQKLNVWAEMYPGHFHHLERACSPILPTDRYVQFLGFDNSYFYTIVHGALARIAQICGHDWPLPERLVINRFYNLGFEKFSTSRGVVVWANDLARRHDPDLIRLFLALHGPEHDEASFDAAAADERIRQLATILDRVATSFNASGLPADTSLSGPLARFFARIPALRSSMREIATSALHCLEFITRGIGASDEQTVRQAPLALKMSLASLCPVFTDRIRLGDHCRIPQFASAERMLLFE
jgi:methionyl-tRNA synthetase